MKGNLEIDILGKVSYTKIIAKASIAAHAGRDRGRRRTNREVT